MSVQSAFMLALAALLYSAPCKAEQYLCLGDQAVGFRWNGSQWEPATFKVDDDKFIIQRKSQDDSFTVKQVGKNYDVLSCSHFGTRILCGGLGMGMLIDTQSLRFQELYGHGWIEGKDTGRDTPNLTIGKCSRLD